MRAEWASTRYLVGQGPIRAHTSSCSRSALRSRYLVLGRHTPSLDAPQSLEDPPSLQSHTPVPRSLFGSPTISILQQSIHVCCFYFSCLVPRPCAVSRPAAGGSCSPDNRLGHEPHRSPLSGMTWPCSRCSCTLGMYLDLGFRLLHETSCYVPASQTTTNPPPVPCTTVEQPPISQRNRSRRCLCCGCPGHAEGCC